MEGPFRAPLPEGLVLIETFARRDGGFVRLAGHLARLEATARVLGFRFDRAAIDAALAAVAGEGPLRVRLTLDREGAPAVEAAPLAPGPAVWRVAIHAERLDPGDPWLRVKTSARLRYDRARASLPAGIDEWLFLNTRGEVCEGTITNVFLRRDGGLLTPPLDCGPAAGGAARRASRRRRPGGGADAAGSGREGSFSSATRCAGSRAHNSWREGRASGLDLDSPHRVRAAGEDVAGRDVGVRDAAVVDHVHLARELLASCRCRRRRSCSPRGC